MVSLTSADNALKTVYLGVVANQLNDNINPLLAKIAQSSQDVWGKEVRKLAPFGINGGVGAGTEIGNLPTAAGNKYAQFVSELKNLYGKIEISDKAMRASSNNVGAFVNLLDSEMEGLIKASTFNFGRMLYGNGSGLLATVSAFNSTSKEITCDSVRNLMEGMVVDVFTSNAKADAKSGFRVAYVDRASGKFFLEGFTGTIEAGDKVYVQNSKDLEITGLGEIFNKNGESLYGLNRETYRWLNPFTNDATGAITDIKMQEAIDFMEEQSGSKIDFITCSANVRRQYQEYVGSFRRNIDVMELAGGHKAISFNGIPVIVDRFVENDAMFLLSSKDFTLHQLCDWRWLEGEDGKVIKQNANTPTYSATLVKYAELVCDHPSGQAKLSGITAAGSKTYNVNLTNEAVDVCVKNTSDEPVITQEITA